MDSSTYISLYVLSLLSGIRVIEVALHKLEIPKNMVISVEKFEVHRTIFEVLLGLYADTGMLDIMVCTHKHLRGSEQPSPPRWLVG
jgi:hypothetical protein